VLATQGTDDAIVIVIIRYPAGMLICLLYRETDCLPLGGYRLRPAPILFVSAQLEFLRGFLAAQHSRFR
jgi:hypothetical protein